MSYPLLAVMNISHRYFDLEEFFSSAAASGYTCCELWTGAMHLYVDCHGYDSLEQVRELSQRYGVRIVGLCPEQNNPKPWNIAARGNEARARTLAYFKNVVDIADRGRVGSQRLDAACDCRACGRVRRATGARGPAAG